VPGQGCRVSLGNPTTRESLDTQTQTHGLTPSLRHSLHFCLVLVYIFYISEFTSLPFGLSFSFKPSVAKIQMCLLLYCQQMHAEITHIGLRKTRLNCRI